MLLVAAFALSPLAPYAKSLAAMKIYSHMNENKSLLTEKGIDISIPGGGATKETDWYPFVMTFNADTRFQSFVGDRDACLTIMYNFPAFDLLRGCSRIYDDKSPYYNGFYGAYAMDGDYGFKPDGTFDTSKASLVPEFDMRRLVLEDLGMERSAGVFEWAINDVREDVSYVGFDGWTCIDADMQVNGTLHAKDEYLQNYIQYGAPKYPLDGASDFAPVDMKGRVYARYFEEWDVSIYFYIMVRNSEVLEACDEEILSASRVSGR